MSGQRPEPTKGPTPDQQRTEAELSKHAFETAGALRLLAEHMEGLGWRTDEYSCEDLARVANSLHGMSIRAAMSSGDTALLNEVTGRNSREL